MPETVRPKLPDLLEWLQAILVDPDGVEAGIRSPEARRHVDITPERAGEIILPSATLSPLERIGVYAEMYPTRMRDALSTDFPAVKHFLGDGGWKRLIADYVLAHPSRHQNLNQLGRHLPRFIRTARSMPDQSFLADLAELEQAMVEVFDAAESPLADVKDLVDLAPEQWASAFFRPIRAFRVCTFNYPVNAYLQAVKDERETPPIRRAQTYVAVYRKKYSVWRMQLTRIQYRVVKLLVEGKTVAEALYKGAKGGGTDVAGLAVQLRSWFREWLEDGWFTAIEIRPDEG
jgi:hypothetical protein